MEPRERKPIPAATDAVRRRFGRESDRWDLIYSDSGPPLARLWDRWTRQNVRERFRRTFEISGDLAGKSVLDLGCGSGRYLIEAAGSGASRVVGVDLSADMIASAGRLAQQVAPGTRIELYCGDLRTLPIEGPFDHVWALGLLDYVDDPAAVLARAARWTRGSLIASFPDRAAIRARPRQLYWALRGLRIQLYDRSRIEQLARDAGLKITSIERLGPIFLLAAGT